MRKLYTQIRNYSILSIIGSVLSISSAIFGITYNSNLYVTIDRHEQEIIDHERKIYEISQMIKHFDYKIDKINSNIDIQRKDVEYLKDLNFEVYKKIDTLLKR